MASHNSSTITEIHQQIFSDEKVCVFACMHSPILVNGYECWKLDNIVYSDSIIDCFESFDGFDSSDGQLLEPLTLPSIDSTASNDHSARNDHFRKHEKQQQSCQPNLSRKGSKSNKDKRKCSAPNCNPDSTSFFSFPNLLQGGKINESNVERCRIWMKNCGNLSLLNKPSSKLFKQNFLCAKHFNDDQFTNKTKKRLKQDAIPTIFPNTVSLTDAQMKAYPVIGNDFTEYYMFKHKQDDTTCNATLINDEIQEVTTISIIDEIQRKFQEEMMSLEWRICPSCNAKFFCSKNSKKKCVYTKPVCRKNSLITFDDVPEELKNMSFIEEQLIAKIHPVVTVVKLKNHQLGYKGNVINFPQDVKEFASQLPHKISDLNNVLTIRASKDLKPVDFQVRADKVKKALEWLVANNKHYYNIEISTENLSLLPQNGNVFESVMGIGSFCDTESSDQNEPEYDSTEDIDDIFESGTPIMRQAAEADQIHSVINYPSIGSEPINEFNTDGYIAQAFPCLFPKGNGDFSTTKSKRESIISYFKHLMRYKDDRFAQHPRFRYFALNTYMRWSALRNGNVFVKKQPDLEDMSLENLKTRLQNDPGLLKKIMFQSSNIHGSKAYWFARGKELLAMVEQLGLPTLFFTLSAADLHWPDLFKLLAPDEDLQNITEHRRRQLVRDNPLIVDTFFLHRAETFIEEVLKKKYKIKDLWYRIEYQHRGSPHIHGLLYLEGAPDVTNLINLPEEQQQIIIDYFNELVTAFHPNIDQPPAEIHPSRKDLFSISDLDTDLAELLNRVQRHTQCSESYCLRKNKVTNQLECRFGFPQEYIAEAKINIDESKVEFVPQRNDNRLNKYNQYIIQTWRANIDVAPVLSKRALVNYLTKYISKCEQKSSQLSDLMSTINEASQQNKSVKHAIQKLYIKCCSERDFSAQETCHLLMGLKLYSAGGRTFISINFNSQNEWRRLSQNNPLSLIEKYQVRSERLEHKCLWEVAKMYSLPSETRHKKDAIVQVYPKYRKEVSQDNEKYYRQQVLLYLPWRDEATVMGCCTTWRQVYEQNLEIITKNSGNICNFENETPDEDQIEEPNEQEFISTDEWMALSAMGPDQAMEEVDLGNREIDLSYDWKNNVKDYEQYGGIAGLSMYLQQMKDCYKETEKESTSLGTDTNIALNDDQKKAMDLLKEQLQSITSDDGKILSDVPRRTIVQGRAGTGKSLLISKMTQLIKQTLGDKSYILLGPTGVSANNINGATIQSKLRIYKSTPEFTELRGTSLKTFQEEMENVEFVFIDEYSMVGCEMLHKVDQRLRQGKQNFHEEFGGLFIYLLGDMNQLPPVLDVPVYSENQNSMEAISGKTLFGTFQKAIFLEKIHRQNNPKFQEILNNISAGNMLKEDYHVLETRFTTNVTITTRKEFENELHLYPLKKMVKDYNKDKLRCSKIPGTISCQPVAKIPANVSDKKNCNKQLLKNEALEETLYVSKGCKIMLRTNLWTDRGLVNGTTGELIDILYHTDATPQEDAPAVLLCKFDGYNGPFLDNESKIIPIVPIQKTIKDDNGRTFTMSQFPITVCYGCTIHKSQGLTLQRIFVNIGKSERQAGLTYVAISRAKSLEGLLLEPFPYARYFTIGRSSAISQRRVLEQHLRAMAV